MKYLLNLFMISFIFVMAEINIYAQNPSTSHLLYDQPASLWTDAMPIGNGRLGAMVFSRTHEELIQLNESRQKGKRIGILYYHIDC